ncbi:MAG: FAD-dependent oxidoreductase, partial [Balneolales bacterium]|nr:FAD-dependent oxidoreductase [Balneolales bacterium]
EKIALGSMAAGALPWVPLSIQASVVKADDLYNGLKADIVIAGGGLGGCAAALAALRNGHSVILTEETDWIGGQLSQQGVPPDEHRWIESHGSSELYRAFRSAIRQYYKEHYPLTEEARAREFLNPGDGSVSRLCHEPKVALAVLQQMMAPWESARKLLILKNHKVTSAETKGDKVELLKVRSALTGQEMVLRADYFVDATELGDLLPLTGTEYITGSESKAQTGEWHASDTHRPDNHQAFTMCFAMDYVPGENWTIPKPRDYDFWINYTPEMSPPWAGKLLEMNYSSPRDLQPKDLAFHPLAKTFDGILNLWNYRRIINKNNFKEGLFPGDITIVNWPQNDYFPGNLIDVSEADVKKHI